MHVLRSPALRSENIVFAVAESAAPMPEAAPVMTTTLPFSSG